MIATIIAVVVVVYVGYFVIEYLNKSEINENIRKQEAARQEQYERDQIFQAWVDKLEAFNQNINNEMAWGVDFDPGDRFDQLWELGELCPESRYTETFETVLVNIENSYRSAISEVLPHLQGLYSLPTVLGF